MAELVQRLGWVPDLLRVVACSCRGGGDQEAMILQLAARSPAFAAAVLSVAAESKDLQASHGALCSEQLRSFVLPQSEAREEMLTGRSLPLLQAPHLQSPALQRELLAHIAGAADRQSDPHMLTATVLSLTQHISQQLDGCFGTSHGADSSVQPPSRTAQQALLAEALQALLRLLNAWPQALAGNALAAHLQALHAALDRALSRHLHLAADGAPVVMSQAAFQVKHAMMLVE